ncbi:MAG: hypothetical protein E6I08_12305 [Chloroflexi bacterium]|nr:MAG: hypothetical protein E6I08_12305 [Chloroflexota bacterium]
MAQVATPEADGACQRGVGDDGDGTFLLGYFAHDPDRTGPRHLFFQIHNGSAVRVGGTVFGGEDTTQEVFSQPTGFSVFTPSDIGGSALDTWSHDGVFVSGTQIAPRHTNAVPNPPNSIVGVDPSGGTAAVKTFFTSDKGWITTYQRFDKSGAPETGEVQIDSGEHHVRAVGVALSGHALVLLDGTNDTFRAQWLARDGTAISKPFSLQSGSFPRFQFLMDGSLALGFVRSYGDPPSLFVSRIEDGAEVAGPLPAWLSQRSLDVVFAIRQGRGYAAFGGDGGGACGADLEVLAAPSGKSCGCLKVPHLTREASVGRDGSLMVPGLSTSCSYDLYPKLFR